MDFDGLNRKMQVICLMSEKNSLNNLKNKFFNFSIVFQLQKKKKYIFLIKQENSLKNLKTQFFSIDFFRFLNNNKSKKLTNRKTVKIFDF